MNKNKMIVILESISIIIFMTLLAIIMKYHEPCFDEAQAWLISRDSSFFDMIWNILRYEGHPPLWYILLYLPSHLEIPYEVGLKLINYIFITLTVILIVKKSPFPLTIRILLPFTYFIFYQYGVISRSYSLFAFLLFLVAFYFPVRNKKPFKFSILLALLCGVLMHGILISFGIAIAWLIEIYNSIKKKSSNVDILLLKKVIWDKRILSLIFLAAINIAYLLLLWPKTDKYTYFQKTSFDFRDIFYQIFIVPLNSIFTDIQYSKFANPNINIILLCLLSALLTFIFFIWILKKGMLLYTLLPYVLILSFVSLIYFADHHTGIYMLFYIFSIWIALNNNLVFKEYKWAINLYNKFILIIKERNIIKYLLTVCISFLFLTQIYWSISASLFDIQLPYSNGKEIASYIKKHKLEKYNIFNFGAQDYNEKKQYFAMDIASQPYFKYNIFYNINHGDRNKSFLFHRQSELISSNHKSIISNNKPDIILSSVAKKNIKFSILSDIINMDEYVHIDTFYGYHLWKDRLGYAKTDIYINKILCDKLSHLGSINVTE